MSLISGDIWTVIKKLNQSEALDESIVVLEDVSLENSVFALDKRISKLLFDLLQRKITIAEVMVEIRIMAKHAQGIGKSKASCEVLKHMFKKAGVPMVLISPSRRDRADKPGKTGPGNRGIALLSMPTKTNAYQFQMLTGFSGRSNEHSRDAATLVWGRSIKWAETQLTIQKQQELLF